MKAPCMRFKTIMQDIEWSIRESSLPVFRAKNVAARYYETELDNCSTRIYIGLHA